MKRRKMEMLDSFRLTPHQGNAQIKAFGQRELLVVDPDAVRDDKMGECPLTRAACGPESQARNFMSVDMNALIEEIKNREGTDPEAKALFEKSREGFWVPERSLAARGYRKREGAETVTDGDGTAYVKFSPYLASGSNMRTGKLVATDWPFGELAPLATGSAEYLEGPTHDPNKGVNRLGQVLSKGTGAPGFRFTSAFVPDLYTAQTAEAVVYDNGRDWNDGRQWPEGGLPEARTVTRTECATDGCGFILPAAAKRLADELGMDEVPSGFQVRMGGSVKGMLYVFPYDEYTGGAVSEEVLFTDSMVKARFDVGAAELVVVGGTDRERGHDTWNRQMVGMLDRQLGEGFLEKHIDELTMAAIDDAIRTPEGAARFFRMVDDVISAPDPDWESGEGEPLPEPAAKLAEGPDGDPDDGDELGGNRELAKRLLEANPELAHMLSGFKGIVLSEADKLLEKAQKGQVVMPDTSTAKLAPDPVAVFNRMHVENGPDGRRAYNFEGRGRPAVPDGLRVPELEAGECLYAGSKGLGGEIIVARTPLAHPSEIAKLRNGPAGGFASPRRERLYGFMKDACILNCKDMTLLRMGGADLDGDGAKIVRLPEAVEAFRQEPVLLTLDAPGQSPPKPEKKTLDETTAIGAVYLNMSKNPLSELMVEASNVRELLNDHRNGGGALVEMLNEIIERGVKGHPLHKYVAGLAEGGKWKKTSRPEKSRLLREAADKRAVPALERYAMHLKHESGVVVDAVKTGAATRFEGPLMGFRSTTRPGGVGNNYSPESVNAARDGWKKQLDGGHEPVHIKATWKTLNRETGKWEAVGLAASALPKSMRGKSYSMVGKKRKETKARRNGELGSDGQVKGGVYNDNREKHWLAVHQTALGPPEGIAGPKLLGAFSAKAAEMKERFNGRVREILEKYPADGFRLRESDRMADLKSEYLGTLEKEAKTALDGTRLREFKSLYDGLEAETAQFLDEQPGGRGCPKNRCMMAVAMLQTGDQGTSMFAYRAFPEGLEEALAMARNPDFAIVRVAETGLQIPETATALVVRDGKVRLQACDAPAGAGNGEARPGNWEREGATVPDGSYAIVRDRETGGVGIAVPGSALFPAPGRDPAENRTVEFAMDFKGAETFKEKRKEDFESSGQVGAYARDAVASGINIDSLGPMLRESGKWDVTLTLSSVRDYGTGGIREAVEVWAASREAPGQPPIRIGKAFPRPGKDGGKEAMPKGADGTRKRTERSIRGISDFHCLRQLALRNPGAVYELGLGTLGDKGGPAAETGKTKNGYKQTVSLTLKPAGREAPGLAAFHSYDKGAERIPENLKPRQGQALGDVALRKEPAEAKGGARTEAWVATCLRTGADMRGPDIARAPTAETAAAAARAKIAEAAAKNPQGFAGQAALYESSLKAVGKGRFAKDSGEVRLLQPAEPERRPPATEPSPPGLAAYHSYESTHLSIDAPRSPDTLKPREGQAFGDIAVRRERCELKGGAEKDAYMATCLRTGTDMAFEAPTVTAALGSARASMSKGAAAKPERLEALAANYGRDLKAREKAQREAEYDRKFPPPGAGQTRQAAARQAHDEQGALQAGDRKPQEDARPAPAKKDAAPAAMREPGKAQAEPKSPGSAEKGTAPDYLRLADDGAAASGRNERSPVPAQPAESAPKPRSGSYHIVRGGELEERKGWLYGDIAVEKLNRDGAETWVATHTATGMEAHSWTAKEGGRGHAEGHRQARQAIASLKSGPGSQLETKAARFQALRAAHEAAANSRPPQERLPSPQARSDAPKFEVRQPAAKGMCAAV